MNIKTIAALACGLAASLVPPAHAQATPPTAVLAPVKDGMIFDHAPYDGLPDELEAAQAAALTFDPGIIDLRASIEFDLESAAGRRIRSATLELVPVGKAVPPSTTIMPIEVRGYFADGRLRLKDFHRGTFVTVFDGFATVIDVPVSLDVTQHVRGVLAKNKRFIGFALRTNARGGISFGSLEAGPAASLVIEFR